MRWHELHEETDWWSPFEDQTEYLLRAMRENQLLSYFKELRETMDERIEKALPDTFYTFWEEH